MACVLASLVGSAILSPTHTAHAQSVEKKIKSLSTRISRIEKDIKNISGSNSGSGGQSATGRTGERGPKGDKGDKGLKGDRGPAGPAGPGVDPAKLQTKIVDTIFDAQDLPMKNVLYQFDPVVFREGAQKYAAIASIKYGNGGAILHRILVRKAVPTDATMYLENSPVIFDSGIRSDLALSGSAFQQKTGTVESYVWLSLNPKSQFPVLRAMVGDAQTRTTTSCGQGVIDVPFSRNINDEVPAAGAGCSFGSKLSYGVASLTGLGVTLTPGVRIAADDATLLKVCQHNGYPKVANVTKRSFASCSNNTVVKWNGTAWQIMNACSFNSGIDQGDLVCSKQTL